MKYRRFGNTDLEMPVFSCGGMRYQHKWNDIDWSEVPDEGQKNAAVPKKMIPSHQNLFG